MGVIPVLKQRQYTDPRISVLSTSLDQLNQFRSFEVEKNDRKPLAPQLDLKLEYWQETPFQNMSHRRTKTVQT